MKLSIVVPVLNEEPNLSLLYERLQRVATASADDYEIIFVNDGSTDGSLAAMGRLHERDPRVKCISLSRNFGHQIASTAGLDRASGDAVVLIDADLQDPPEVIAEMVARWRSGAAVVYARRRVRHDESFLKKATAHLFYRLLNRISDVDIPLDTGDFRLIDRRVVQVLRRCRENPRFLRGLVAWAGFRQDAVHYDRAGRHAGQSKYRVGKMFNLAWAAACSFSVVPLQLGFWFGSAAILLSLLLGVVLIVQRFCGVPVEGSSLLACALFLLGGVQLVTLGIASRYVGYILQTVQNRPLYVVESQRGWDDVTEDAATDVTRQPESSQVTAR